MLSGPARGNVRRLLCSIAILCRAHCPSALFWRNHGVRRAAGQRYYRGKCSPDDLTSPFTAYALTVLLMRWEARTPVRLAARVTVALLDVWRAACRQSEIVALLFSQSMPRRRTYCRVTDLIAANDSHWRIGILSGRRYYRWWAYGAICSTQAFIGATRAAEMRTAWQQSPRE